MTRTDVHRPSQIEPADYVFVAFEYLRPKDVGVEFMLAERMRIRHHMAQTGGTYSGHEHGGNCHICGSVNAVYTALFYHKPTNVYVRTGLDCAEKLECQGIEAFRRNVANARENYAGKRKAQAVLADAGLGAAWEIYMGPEGREAGELYSNRSDRREENTICDICSRLVKYGSISSGQINYVRALLDRIANRAVVAAQRAAEAETAQPVPVVAGRAKIVGTVLTIKEPGEYDQFPQSKILVQHADGWKVWGSLPASLANVKRGDVVEFSAALKVSDRDPKFGFFSRPTQAKIVA